MHVYGKNFNSFRTFNVASSQVDIFYQYLSFKTNRFPKFSISFTAVLYPAPYVFALH